MVAFIGWKYGRRCWRPNERAVWSCTSHRPQNSTHCDHDGVPSLFGVEVTTLNAAD